LLVSSKHDPVFPPGTSAAIAAAHRWPETLLVVPGRDHAIALLDCHLRGESTPRSTPSLTGCCEPPRLDPSRGSAQSANRRGCGVDFTAARLFNR